MQTATEVFGRECSADADGHIQETVELLIPNVSAADIAYSFRHNHGVNAVSWKGFPSRRLLFFVREWLHDSGVARIQLSFDSAGHQVQGEDIIRETLMAIYVGYSRLFAFDTIPVLRDVNPREIFEGLADDDELPVVNESPLCNCVLNYPDGGDADHCPEHGKAKYRVLDPALTRKMVFDAVSIVAAKCANAPVAKRCPDDERVVIPAVPKSISIPVIDGDGIGSIVLSTDEYDPRLVQDVTDYFQTTDGGKEAVARLRHDGCPNPLGKAWLREYRERRSDATPPVYGIGLVEKAIYGGPTAIADAMGGPAAMDDKRPCPDCNDTRQYRGLSEVRPCPTCCGEP